MIFKRYLPRSLFGRAFLILVLPVVVLQALLASEFIRRHYDGVTSQMAAGVARELNYIVAEVEAAADFDTARAQLAVLSIPLGARFELVEGGLIERETLRRFYDITGGSAEEALKAGVRRPITVDLTGSDRTIGVEIQTAKGVIRSAIDRRRMSASNPHQLLVFTGLASLVLVVVAVLFLRNQVRPIRELAEAADAFGRGMALAFEPKGAEEVRRAGAAFLAMRDRIERHVEQRTRMLSGVSHDLRTPLTRMKLALAMMDDAPEAAELGRDVREMEHMIDAFLAFAREESAEEMALHDPRALLHALADDARRAGLALHVEDRLPPGTATIAVRPAALRRALGNLLGNAGTFGDTVRLSASAEDGQLCFSVEDDGPGIPEADREAALRPFTRLDAARNQNRASGVGLGLSIAADIAHAHGGTLRLETSPDLGGLAARLCLPR